MALPIMEELEPIENIHEMITEVRNYILDEYEKKPDLYDPNDIERVKQDDWHVERFIRRRKTIKESQEMLNHNLLWRNEFKFSKMKMTDFPAEFFKLGAMFRYAKDKWGNQTVYIRARFHHKIKEMSTMIKKFFFFHLDQMDMETGGRKMVVVFDCKGVRLANMDTDLTWFVATALLKYYPHGTEYVLVYEMPWFFHSVWTVIKTLLPTELAHKVKFTDHKDDIFNYFDKENIPIYMGGTCKMNYHQVPKGCKSIDEYFKENNFSEKRIQQIIKTWEPDMAEAEKEAKIIESM